jgi:single-strand DNA-binding protein
VAEGFNKVMLLGNLGADPELRYTKGGQAIMKLRLATTERFKDQSGEWKDRTEWHRVTMWGKRGEALSKFLTKGSTIFVEGSLRTSSWEKEGVKQYSTEINASNIVLAGGKRGEARGGDESRGGDGSSRPDHDFGADYGPGPGLGDDDIPF